MTDGRARRPLARPTGRPWRSRRTILSVAGALLCLLAVALLVRRYRSWGGDRSSDPGSGMTSSDSASSWRSSSPRPRPPEVDSRIFQVTEATGRVETRRGEQWEMVVTGDVLTQDDLVRTVAGRAILRRGATEIELRERVEIRLDRISQAGASVDLRRGRVVANVGRAGGRVAITASQTRTANEGSAPARFVVTTDDRGRVAVATTEGTAVFEAAGRSVTVPAGETTHAEAGEPPADPEVISEDVFLSVAWPSGDRREEKLPLTGRTDPHALVRINGAAAEVDRAGAFVASIPIRDGANSIEVEVEDPAGRIRRERREIRKIPTRPPRLAPVPTDLWKK